MPRARRAATRPLTGFVVGLALLAAGCSSALAGHGTADGAAPSVLRSAPEPSAPASNPLITVSSASATGPSLATPTPPPVSTPVAPPTHRVTAAVEARRLVGLLEPKPAGAVTWSESWGHNITPTLAQFVRRQYDASDVAAAEAQLRAQGLLAIAHRTWIAADSNQADVTLLGFTSSAGATSRWLSASRAQADSVGARRLHIPGGGSNVRAYYHPKLDDQGYVRTVVYARRGSIVAETFAYTPSRLKSADIVKWSQAQLHRLPG